MRNTLKKADPRSSITSCTEARCQMYMFSNKWQQAVKRLIRINKSYKYAETTNANNNVQVSEDFNKLTQRKLTQDVRSEASYRHNNDGKILSQ